MTTAYRRTTLEVTLEAIDGGLAWATGKRATERLVTATLIWPRPLVAGRVSAHTLPFRKDGLDLTGRDWSERILFKEQVEGPFGLTIQVSESLTAQRLAHITAAIGEALLRAAGSEAAHVAVGPGLTSLARFPFTFLAGQFAGIGKIPNVVAAGRITLEPGTSGPIEVPLRVPEDVVRVRQVRRVGRTQPRREVIRRRDDPAGTVRLEAVYYR